jgi:hypothetical protein
MYILTSPAKVQWINEWFELDDYEEEIVRTIYQKNDFFKKINKKGNLVTISSTFHNSHNLPSNYISNQEKNLPSYLHDMLIYGNPFSKSGGEFYKCFDRQKHIQTLAYDSSKALHLTFDFNVHPYMTCTVHQVHEVSGMRVVAEIDEFCIPSPNNSTPAICRAVLAKYGAHQGAVFVYGDPSGKAQDTRSEKDVNDFSIIQNQLRSMRARLKVLGSAPSVSLRGDFINAIFDSNYANIHFIVAHHCKKSINDYTFLKEDSEGKKLKQKQKNKETGVSYEKYGHTSDANDYFLCTYFIKELEQFRNGRGR